MVTNAGTIVYTKQADLPDYGSVWFNKNSIANIISMSEAERRGHKITFTPGCLTLTNDTNGHKTVFKITSANLSAFEIPIDGVYVCPKFWGKSTIVYTVANPAG
jgi:hypothetical protein